MTTPSIRVAKQDGNTGVIRPGADGITAFVAASSSGDVDSPSMHNDPGLAQTEFGDGPLTDYPAYLMPETGRGSLLCRSAASTLGAYSAIVKAGGGTAAPAATASTYPVDDFDVVIKFTGNGALGTAGVSYQWSLNGGKTFSALTALGVALIITIPNTGISITIGTATQTILDGETVSFTTTRPMPNNTDLPASLEALRVTSSPFEAVVIDGESDDDTVALVATWLLSLNNMGKFPVVFLTVRPMGAAESETAYKDAMAALIASAVCDDIVLCADEGDMVSQLRGISQARPSGWGIAAHAMKFDIGVEPAEIGLGPVTGVSITDARNNPRHHNEEKTPGLDDLRLTTYRTVEGEEGVYITNTRLLSASGSDYVFLPHARCMNRAAGITVQVLRKRLSRGVAKDPKPGPQGQRYIAEHEAKLVEALVQTAIDPALQGKVDDIKFSLSRTDDISSNGFVKVHCFIESVSLAYVKEFDVTVKYVKQISQAAAQ